MKALVTGSSIDQTDRCPPSAVLPHAGHLSRPSDKGNAVHLHMQHRVLFGIDEAVHRLEAVAREFQLPERDKDYFLWLCRHIEFMPPKGAIAEQALCLLRDGNVAVVDGGRGSYELPDDNMLLPMTLDLMWSQPEPLRLGADGPECPPGSTLFVADYKTGDDVHVNPVEFNGQALVGALVAARWTRAERVVPSILYLHSNATEEWDTLPHYLDAQSLAEIEASLVDVIARMEVQRAKYRAGEPLDYVTGDHCQWCKAAWCCAAKLTTLKRLVSPRSKKPMAPEALTLPQAQRLATFVAQGQALVDDARAALEMFVKAHNYEAIKLPDGKVWGAYLQEQKEIVPDVAMPILREQLGSAAWETVKISRGAIDKLVRRTYVETEDESAPQRVKRLMGMIAKAEGLKPKTVTKWGVHRPMPEGTVAPEDSG